MLENWRVGGLEVWRIGVLENWRIRLLEDWKVGVLVYCNFRISPPNRARTSGERYGRNVKPSRSEIRNRTMNQTEHAQDWKLKCPPAHQAHVKRRVCDGDRAKDWSIATYSMC